MGKIWGSKGAHGKLKQFSILPSGSLVFFLSLIASHSLTIYLIFKSLVSSPDAVPTPIWTSVYGQKAWLSRKFSITLPFPIVQVLVVSSTMWFSWFSFFSQLCYFVHVLYLYRWGYNFNLIFVGLRSRRPPPTSTSLLQLQLPPVPTTPRKVAMTALLPRLRTIWQVLRGSTAHLQRERRKQE